MLHLWLQKKLKNLTNDNLHMNKTLEKLYALRSQMSAADLPLDAIDEKIRVEEEKASSWKKDLDEITSTMKTFIQPIYKNGEMIQWYCAQNSRKQSYQR